MKKSIYRYVRLAALLVAANLFFGTPSWAFKILVDLNTLRGAEAAVLQDASNPGTSQLAADGVWMATPINSNLAGWPDRFSDPSIWQSVLTNLNGNNWTVAEDEYNWLGDDRWPTTAIASLRSWSRPISQALVLNDDTPNLPNPILTYDQVTNAYNAAYPAQVGVLARRYDDSDGSLTAVNTALPNQFCGGVTFELAVSDVGNNDYPGLNLAAGITNCLAAGKPCYIILAAKGDGYEGNGSNIPDTRCLNYTTAVANFMQWLNGQGLSSALHSPSFFIVLASYGGPGRYTGFIDGLAGDPNQNSVRSAMTWVKAFRMWGVY